jgi:hypothetical protein
MARSPDNRRGIESSLHHGRAAQWPAGRRRQLSGRVSGSWNGEHTEADQNEKCQPNMSAKCAHAWSLRIIALIVQRFRNLWTSLEGPPSAVDNRNRRDRVQHSSHAWITVVTVRPVCVFACVAVSPLWRMTHVQKPGCWVCHESNRFRSAIRPQFQRDSREDLGMSSR